MATLVFFRSKGIGGAAIVVQVDLDGQSLTSLSWNSVRRCTVAPGTHSINAHQFDFQFGQESSSYEFSAGQVILFFFFLFPFPPSPPSFQIDVLLSLQSADGTDGWAGFYRALH